MLASLLALLGWAAALAGSPDVPELRTALTEFNAGATFKLPDLSEAELERLARGEVVGLLRRGDQGVWRAVGLYVTPQPRQAVWIACQDAHFSNVARVTEARLREDPAAGRATWYGHVELPAPFTDRQWAVDVWNNTALAAASGGRDWEHPWRLNPSGLQLVRPLVQRGEVGALTEADIDEAIYTPTNDGAWVALVLPTSGQTLLVYHSATDIGGVVPDRLLAQFVLSGMEDLLRRVESRARDEVPAHYRADHAPIRGGDNQPLPPY